MENQLKTFYHSHEVRQRACKEHIQDHGNQERALHRVFHDFAACTQRLCEECVWHLLRDPAAKSGEVVMDVDKQSLRDEELLLVLNVKDKLILLLFG